MSISVTHTSDRTNAASLSSILCNVRNSPRVTQYIIIAPCKPIATPQSIELRCLVREMLRQGMCTIHTAWVIIPKTACSFFLICTFLTQTNIGHMIERFVYGTFIWDFRLLLIFHNKKWAEAEKCLFHSTVITLIIRMNKETHQSLNVKIAAHGDPTRMRQKTDGWYKKGDGCRVLLYSNPNLTIINSFDVDT